MKKTEKMPEIGHFCALYRYLEIVDVTVEAQKILSCIIRTGQNYGIKVIADVLKGNATKDIVIKGLNKQSTYGIMKESKLSEIRYIIAVTVDESPYSWLALSTS